MFGHRCIRAGFMLGGGGGLGKLPSATDASSRQTCQIEIELNYHTLIVNIPQNYVSSF